MAEQSADLKKLIGIASDLELPSELRAKTIKSIGNMGTHEALLSLLGLVANEKLTKGEREFALKQAERIIKRSPQ
jgi:hypothetical protein